MVSLCFQSVQSIIKNSEEKTTFGAEDVKDAKSLSISDPKTGSGAEDRIGGDGCKAPTSSNSN
jgi:hypothetical protein